MPKTTTNQVSANLVINEVNFISIVASEVGATNANFVNTNSSVVNASTLNVDDINIDNLEIENANITNLNVSTVNASTGNLNTLNVSTANGSTGDFDNINSSLSSLQNQIDNIDLQDFSLINVSTLNGSTANIIDLNASTGNLNTLNVSTANGSTGNFDNIDATLTSLQNQINNIDITDFDNINVSNLSVSVLDVDTDATFNCNVEIPNPNQLLTNVVKPSSGNTVFFGNNNLSQVNNINGENFDGLVSAVNQNTSDIEVNEIAIANLNTSVSSINGQVQLNAGAILSNSNDITSIEGDITTIQNTLTGYSNTGFQTSGYVYGVNACFSNKVTADELKAEVITKTLDLRVEGDYEIITSQGNSLVKTVITTDAYDEVNISANNVSAIRFLGATTNTTNANHNTINCSTINASIAVFDETVHQQHDAVDLNVSDLHASTCRIDQNCSIAGTLKVNQIATFTGDTIGCNNVFLNSVSKIKLNNNETANLSAEGQIIYDRGNNFGGATRSGIAYRNNTQTTYIYDRQNFLIDNAIITNILDPISDNETAITNLNTSVSSINSQVQLNGASIGNINTTLSGFNTAFTTGTLTANTTNSSVINSSTITTVYVNSSNGNVSQLTSVQHTTQTLNASTINTSSFNADGDIDCDSITTTDRIISPFYRGNLGAFGDTSNYNRCFIGDLSRITEYSTLTWNASLLEQLGFGVTLGSTYGNSTIFTTANGATEGLRFMNSNNINSSNPNINASLLRDGDMYIRTSLDVPTLNASILNVDNINVSTKSASTINANTGNIVNINSSSIMTIGDIVATDTIQGNINVRGRRFISNDLPPRTVIDTANSSTHIKTDTLNISGDTNSSGSFRIDEDEKYFVGTGSYISQTSANFQVIGQSRNINLVAQNGTANRATLYISGSNATFTDVPVTIRDGNLDMNNNSIQDVDTISILGRTNCSSTIIYEPSLITSDVYALWLKSLSIRMDGLTANRVLGIDGSNIVSSTTTTISDLNGFDGRITALEGNVGSNINASTIKFLNATKDTTVNFNGLLSTANSMSKNIFFDTERNYYIGETFNSANQTVGIGIYSDGGGGDDPDLTAIFVRNEGLTAQKLKTPEVNASNVYADKIYETIPINYVKTFYKSEPNIYLNGGGTNEAWGLGRISYNSGSTMTWNEDEFRSSTSYITATTSGQLNFNVNNSNAFGVWRVDYNINVKNQSNKRVNFRATLENNAGVGGQFGQSTQYVRMDEGKSCNLSSYSFFNITATNQLWNIYTEAENGTGSAFADVVTNYLIQGFSISFTYLGKN